MPCYHPLKAIRTNGIVKVLPKDTVVYSFTLPCGQCVGCRLEKSREWALRCMHEASLYSDNCFITLTYDDAHVPEDGGLHYSHFQYFMKRLREKYPHRRIRFYMAGEYGGQFGRPHFHACLFNFAFNDLVIWRKSNSGHHLYRSSELESLWRYGYSSVGAVTFESAAYVARYIMKKQTGKGSAGAYDSVDTETGEIFSRRPEFNKMSLKPGIGAQWFDKFHTDVFPRDAVIHDGTPNRVPRYYDKRLKLVDPDTFTLIKEKRILDAINHMPDNTPQRLQAKETVAKAQISQLRRGLTK